MSNLAYVIDRIDAGAKVRFFIDYFGTEYIELKRGWLPSRRVALSAEQLDVVKRALRDRRRRRELGREEGAPDASRNRPMLAGARPS